MLSRPFPPSKNILWRNSESVFLTCGLKNAITSHLGEIFIIFQSGYKLHESKNSTSLVNHNILSISNNVRHPAGIHKLLTAYVEQLPYYEGFKSHLM